ncbi:MAG: ribonuclease H [Flavobacteriia bacterium]|nr:ribonuclease H [Flavobacteriia bacterium]OIP45753.1 MAG: ribonuclease H [Flavobacteriaceae bacterium CG2_30_31_66]PIV97177.1 MAG: ribonuclease H [Flavobacteriaceae bacterium CG17_big_fil_post_rev_8_21_14_2_50_31_13]PIX12644.1 MAG: ribonuclease H [Flavobacteriaceae bacterium CG_4_8_14_3_um_filter_31_8]PIY15851.1 MAG: ribonuclease H [Flavobacteriaceae bacterium CG_4_10_14_3_um_filter_31_253]PIZ12246.1 MAG: ribonuclease H [Flavobacteriaceae bacterium CG_4_10_14_0_8_um_filter_31_99]PJC09845.1 
MAKSKFYVVWRGKKTGVFTKWNVCKQQIDGFEDAQYKSFGSLEEAKIASKGNYNDYKGKDTQKPVLSASEKLQYGNPILESIAVDAACAGNPGIMEYRGVLTHSKREIFKKGPFKNGTNNVGEFLALVHGIALLKGKNQEKIPIYSDSKIAISWILQKKCKTKLQFNDSNKELKELIERAENWLQQNTFKNPILKWETKAWGEIPADFGRK